jgi:hypothetical protein
MELERKPKLGEREASDDRLFPERAPTSVNVRPCASPQFGTEKMKEV